MSTTNDSRGTPPTDFAPAAETLRHGRTRRAAGHRPAQDAAEQPEARGTQHQAPVADRDAVTTETVLNRLRSRLAESEGGG